ncbi:MAG: hypothetical protein IEMM0002_0188 [bacterium]|nr:MAG: hypothetical protein IEMM0002_0188 [bacterium]
MNNYSDEDMEKLSRAIVEAIMSSEPVRRALGKMHNVEDSLPSNFMVFMLRLDSLVDGKNGNKKGEIRLEEFSKEKPKKRKSRKPAKRLPIVDGRLLSENEKTFLDYLSKKFDQKAWLKKNKISLD